MKIIYLPSDPNGRKASLDDFFAGSHDVDELRSYAASEVIVPIQREIVNNIPYRETPKGIIWNKPTRDGELLTAMTNFTARITAEVIEDDGAEQNRYFEIEAFCLGRHYNFAVASATFASLNWV